MAQHMHEDILAISAQGRIQGEAKKVQGAPFFKKNFFFRPEGYSNKPNALQWSRSMWDEVLFLFQSEVRFFTLI